LAALALHDALRVCRRLGSREGNEEEARRARESLVEGTRVLLAGLDDALVEVATASALALGKHGGREAAEAVGARLGSASLAIQVEAREALLLAVGLLPVAEAHAHPFLAAALRSEETRIRASAALAIACWAVATSTQDSPPGGGDPAGRARAFEALLDPSQNVLLRMHDRDGAESVFARGMLARITGRLATWEELLALAVTPSTEERTAVAAAQALLFAPPQSPVRAKMAEQAALPNVGRRLKEPVLAAFLVVSAGDGLPAGVRAAKGFLKAKSREPTGRLDYDVRYHAAIGLVRGFVKGTIAPEVRADAADGLVDGARAHLPHAAPGEHAFRDALEDLVRPVRDTLATTGSLPKDASKTLERWFHDPDALLAVDPVDVALDRLDDRVRSVLGLDSLAKAAAGAGAARVVNKEDQPQRLLLGWMEEERYFTRLDFRADRGLAPAAAPDAGRDPVRELRRGLDR
jgi:hypothetical protein